MNDTLTVIPGLTVGHWTNLEARTGCTVVLCGAEGAVCGVDVRGGAPGTRETDLLNPMNVVERAHAILLSGGSAFGLAAADGVMRFLEERGIGYETHVAKVPIVPTAILFDLGVGRADIRPDAAAGYAACLAASDAPVAQGRVGAGAGATVGKLLGPTGAMDGGVGSASLTLGDGVRVAALAAVNPAGDVIDEDGRILAGARWPDGSFADAEALVTGGSARASHLQHTTLVCVATDARLTKAEATRVAMMAHDGLARAIRPAHTMFDGDTVFALSLGEQAGNLSAIGAAAAVVTARAIRNAVG